MTEKPPQEEKEVPEKKKRKKKEGGKPASEESRANKLRVPKQTKPPITKAKEKGDIKKTSTIEPEKLGKNPKKKTEKIALWAEDVNRSTSANKAKVSKKPMSNKKGAPEIVDNKDTINTKAAKTVTDLIGKKTSLGTIKKIPKIPKKIVLTKKKSLDSNFTVKDGVKRVRKTSFNENPFAKKIENIANHSTQEQSAFTRSNENPFLNKNKNEKQAQVQPRKTLQDPKSLEEAIHFDFEDMQDDENYKLEVQTTHTPIIQTPPFDAGLQINMNFRQEQLDKNNVGFDQQIHQHEQQGSQPQDNNTANEESMDVDDAVQFSYEIMKEVGKRFSPT